MCFKRIDRTENKTICTVESMHKVYLFNFLGSVLSVDSVVSFSLNVNSVDLMILVRGWVELLQKRSVGQKYCSV